MNAAAQELGKLSGELAYQRAREPFRAKARQMLAELGLPPDPRLAPPFILSSSDRLPRNHKGE